MVILIELIGVCAYRNTGLVMLLRYPVRAPESKTAALSDIISG
jgi:hypothetical protein